MSLMALKAVSASYFLLSVTALDRLWPNRVCRGGWITNLMIVDHMNALVAAAVLGLASSIWSHHPVVHKWGLLVPRFFRKTLGTSMKMFSLISYPLRALLV